MKNCVYRTLTPRFFSCPEIRRSIREREGQAAKRLQAVLSAAKGAGIVDADAQISIRDG